MLCTYIILITFQEDICEGKSYWKNMENIFESITRPLSYLNLAPLKLNQQGDLIERKVWVKTKNSQWFNKIFTQMEFEENFRVNCKTFNFLVNELRPHLIKITTTIREPISVVKPVVVALHYLTSYEEYHVVPSLFGIGKTTANLIVHEFVNTVNDFLPPRYVKFPLSEENFKECSRDFEAILGFP